MEVLIVDDEVTWATALHRAVRPLIPAHWSVFVSHDPVEARGILVTEPRIELAFVDFSMPQLDGERVIASAIHARPELKGRIVVCSGWEFDRYMRHRLFTELGCRELRKPATIQQIADVVAEAQKPTSSGS